jgi:hypothetical protein
MTMMKDRLFEPVFLLEKTGKCDKSILILIGLIEIIS